jgi:hypothetical protein
MIKLLLFLIIIPATLLFGRENPFFPVNSLEEIPLTTNKTEKIEPLERATIVLPSTSRIINEVTVKYTNLDGSIGTRKIKLHNSIDWHLPLFISQNYGTAPELKRKKSDNSVSKQQFKKIAELPFIKFYADAKELKIVTQDKLLRNFLLVKPHRIVCDFKRDTNFGTYTKNVPKPFLFKKIRMGTHDGYYRVVIKLDGYYQYKLKETSSGYIFILQ